MYFDDLGVNGASRISKENYFDIFSEEANVVSVDALKHGKTLLALQNENDTNIINFSNRFKKNNALIRYVFSQIGNNTKIVVKPHPLDKNDYSTLVSQLGGEIIKGGNLDDILNSVDAVVALNSTLLIESLQYPVNIYCLGIGILNNKSVVFDCTECELADAWRPDYVNFGAARRRLFEYFKKKQINVYDLASGGGISDFHREIFVNSLKLDVSGLVALDKSKKKTLQEEPPKTKKKTLQEEPPKIIPEVSLKKIDRPISKNIDNPRDALSIVEERTTHHIETVQNKFKFRRKLRKFVKDPNGFMRDFLRKRRGV